jgi:hypothetical protein
VQRLRLADLYHGAQLVADDVPGTSGLPRSEDELAMGVSMDEETLDRVAGELMRQGQYLEAAWMAARMMLLPANASETQLSTMRALFFCGAKCFHATLQAGDFDKRWDQLSIELAQWDVFMRECSTGGRPQ